MRFRALVLCVALASCGGAGQSQSGPSSSQSGWVVASEGGIETHTRGTSETSTDIVFVLPGPNLTEPATLAAALQGQASTLQCDAVPAPVGNVIGPFGTSPVCFAQAGTERSVIVVSFAKDKGADAIAYARGLLSGIDPAAEPDRSALPGANLAKANADPSTPIEGVYHRTRMFGTVMVQDVYVLFKDKTWVDVAGYAPEDAGKIDLTDHDHGKWRRQGKDYVLTFAEDGEELEVDPDYFVPPFKKGTTLNGAYRSVMGAGAGFGGSGAVLITDYMFLYPDGRFATDADAAISLTVPATGGDVSIAGGSTSSTRNKKGTYTIAGHTLTFNFESGETDRMSIIEVKGGGVGNESTYIIGGTLYFTD